MLETLKEFQRYKKLNVINGSFNDETYAALGSEMNELLFKSIRTSFNGTPVIDWLLRGKKGNPPTFYLTSKSPIDNEKSNGNPSDEQSDQELAKLLTAGGIIKAASVDRGGYQGNSHFRLSDGKVYTIHIYGDLTGTSVIGIYLPNFFLPPKYDGGDTVVATTKTGEVLGIAHVRVSSQAELDRNYRLNKSNSKGSRYIGDIGGTGGDGGCYRHSHLHFYPSVRSRNTIKNIKIGPNEPSNIHTQHLLDVRDLLKV